MEYHLSIPLGELDFLGRNYVYIEYVDDRSFQFPLGN